MPDEIPEVETRGQEEIVTEFDEWRRKILRQRLVKQGIFEEENDCGGVSGLHELHEDVLDDRAAD